MTYLPQKFINQSYGCCTVDIIVAIDHNLLVIGYGTLDALDRLIHILHQEWVVQVGELRIKKFIGLFYGVYASLNK
jgi:hypothetical protein